MTTSSSSSSATFKPLTATQLAEARARADKNAEKLKGGLVTATPALKDPEVARKLASAISQHITGDRFIAAPETNGPQHLMEVFPNREVNQAPYVPMAFEFNADSVTVTNGRKGWVVPYEHKNETVQDLFKAATLGWEAMTEGMAPSPMLSTLHALASQRSDPLRAMLVDAFPDFRMQPHPNADERTQYSLAWRGEFIDVTFRTRDVLNASRETDMITIEGPKGTIARPLPEPGYTEAQLLAEVEAAVAQYQAQK